MNAVQQVRQLILAGDVFQVNISQRFSAHVSAESFLMYLRLREENPAPFAAYMEMQSAAVLSASPEMFLSVNESGAVETRPVKGTRARGADPAEDALLARELLSSEKDRAENLMIVDLLRNDLSRACVPGSVFVPALCELERWATVQHLVSSVRGELNPTESSVSVFRACFPGGSITGAPKTRAMQIIASVEGAPRGVYCGSIGYFAADGAALFNIAIRTATITGGVATFSAGGGVVLDSDPALEFEETLAKAAGLVGALCAPPGVDGEPQQQRSAERTGDMAVRR
jgi:para-aminobenzoate synthetase component 1